MKTKSCAEKQKLGAHGEVTLPPDYLKDLGLYPGESEVELRRTGKHMLIEPVKEAVAYRKGKPLRDLVEELTGALPLDQELIEEIAHGGYLPEDV